MSDKAKMDFGGLKVSLPQELDLAAGAPLASKAGEIASEPGKVTPELNAVLTPLKDVATNTWRVTRRMVDPESGEPYEEMQKLFRFVEGITKGLNDAGIRIVDYANQPYDSGMALKVLGFETTPGLTRDEVIETMRPSIFWNDLMLQMGEVVVGVPESPAEQEETDAEAPEDSDISEETDEQAPTVETTKDNEEAAAQTPEAGAESRISRNK